MPHPRRLPDDDDDHAVRRTVPAGTAKRPDTSAPISVFDAGRQAKESARRPRVPLIDLTKVEIRKGVAIPEPRSSQTKFYASLLGRMELGDSVQLPSRQAYSLYAAAKKFAAGSGGKQLKFVLRKLDESSHGVWRTA